MYSYQIVFSVPDKKEKRKYIEESEYIVSDNVKKVIKYVNERIKINDSFGGEFVGLIRRNPILTVLKQKNNWNMRKLKKVKGKRIGGGLNGRM